MAFQAAGKLILPSKPAHRFVQIFNISTNTPCPFTTPLNSVECWKRCHTTQEPFDFLMTKIPDYKPPSPPVNPFMDYLPILTPLIPSATLLAAHHAAFMAFLVYKNPQHFKEETKNLLKQAEERFMGFKGITKKYLAGISESNFNHLCAVSNFIFSPVKTMATYKDFFLDEIKHLRKEGELDNKLLMKTLSKKIQIDADLVPTGDVMRVTVTQPGRLLRIFKCMRTMLLFKGQSIRAFKLPKFPFRPMDVLATFAEDQLTIEFHKCQESETDVETRCFMVPLERP